MYLYLILALQGYCIYHCYTRRNAYYWFLAIIFLPVLGAIIYLFFDAYQKKDVDPVPNEKISVRHPSKTITDLDNKCKFSDSFKNRTLLGDAYLDAKMYEMAIENYEISLSGTFQNDFYATSQLLEAHYLNAQFAKVLELAPKLISSASFKKSKASFLFALALEKEGRIDEAETHLSEFDARYSKYQERLELAKFYIRNEQLKKAKNLLTEIVIESEEMSKTSFSEKKIIIKKVKELLETLA